MNLRLTPNGAGVEDAADPTPPTLAELRRSRARSFILRLMLWVVSPTIAAVIYYGTIASPQYESVAPFLVQAADERSALNFASLLGGISSPGSTRDALAIRDYVLSRDVLAKLQEDHAFLDHYRSKTWDVWSRLREDAGSEDTFLYYSRKVRVYYDNQSGNLTLFVRAFEPERAEAFAKAILEYSEAKVNELSARAREDQLQLARREVSDAEARLKHGQQKVIELQALHSDFNPEQTASEAFGVRGGLRAELAVARAELSQLLAYMQPTAAKVVNARRKVSALEQQITLENRRLVGVTGKKDEPLGATLAEFQSAMFEKEFLQAAYQSALTSLEMARVESARQHRYLIAIASPSRPDQQTHPRILLSVFTVFASALALFGVGSLLTGAIREHARL